MITKLFAGSTTFVLLFSLAAWGQILYTPAKMVEAKTEVVQEIIPPPSIESELPVTRRGEMAEIEGMPSLPEVESSTETSEDLRVLLEEMTLVQLLSETYARVETVCAGNGLNNIRPSPAGPIILIPNAGDLSVDGSNVAIKLAPDGEITFIPRVEGQRIRIPIDLDQKRVGYEEPSLTLAEAKQLIAAGKLVWTAKGFGPYGTGHGLPGHIAECDPLYRAMAQDTVSLSRVELEIPSGVAQETSEVKEMTALFEAEASDDLKVLLEEMTFVQLLSEEYARVETVCAGNGLRNIVPSSAGPKIIIPNAGDLSVEGSNVAAKLDSDGTITFIPRVPGQRIRVPMDLGDKLTGHEVASLTLAEASQLVLAGKLVWTAKGQGPYGNGHGLPGHIAQCDPLYTGPNK
jgi:hypothetical protein